MSHYAVGQDEYIFRLYSIALVAITAAAAFQGDLTEGLRFMMQPGSYNEMETPIEERTWSVSSKWTVLILFATMGFFGASCSAAITKNFGALLMSITSTARKATTLFLSFALFDNECTMEHLVGIVLFIFSLVWKSVSRALPGATGETHEKKRRKIITLIRGSTDLEMAIDTTTITSPVFSKADLDLVQEKVPFLSATNSDDSSSVDSKELRPY
mmetsp:Transcript_1934/g.2611  ORF Transcript_1934/g.2611 Transcript_1934/m.2611 type:complete len:214 (+) Transcript_1934:109-750(+)